VKCRELAEFILEYLEGGLDADTRERFERHLSRCANCRRYIAAYKTTIDLSQRAFADDEATAANSGAPEDLIQAILSSRSR